MVGTKNKKIVFAPKNLPSYEDIAWCFNLASVYSPTGLRQERLTQGMCVINDVGSYYM